MSRVRKLRFPKPEILDVIDMSMGGRRVEKVDHLTQGRPVGIADLVKNDFDQLSGLETSSLWAKGLQMKP